MRRSIQAGTAIAALALALSACSSGTPAATSSATGAPPAAGGELVIWADNSANTAKAIEPLCKKWAEDNGVTCTVKKFNGGTELEDALMQGNSSGDVPDIYEGAHNGIGKMVTNGILSPIDLGANKANFSAAAVAGVTNNGNTYGVPWAVENVALLTNKKLAAECPATLDAAVANAKKLIADGKVTKGLGIALQISSNGDGYHWFPLFTADGGYAFKQLPDGSYDPNDMGIGQEGSIAAAKRLQQLVDDGILKGSVTYDIARETFAKGKSPYFITGPWQIPEQKEALGEDLMVCPVPSWEGSQYKSQPFLGVRVFFQTAKAKNPVLASTFLSDAVMSTEFMDGMYATDPRPPAWNESFTKAAADPFIKGFGEYGQNGMPMPAIPQMDNLFQDWGLAQFKVASGSDPEKTMKEAGDSINKRNAALG